MADEVTISIGFSYSKSGALIDRSETFNADVAGDAVIHNVQSVGTSEELLIHGDIATFGWVFVKNLDSTNYVEVGLTGNRTVKLLAGESAVFRANSADIYAKADSAICNVEYIVVEL